MTPIDILVPEEKLSSIFVGRQQEIETINREYDNLLKGSMGIATVTGAPGAGKTYLVQHALGQLSRNTFVYGKSRQNEEWGLTSIAEIIDQMVRHILTLPRKTLDYLRQELIKKIGDDLVLMAAISPYFKKAFNVTAQIGEQDFIKRQYRVKSAVYKFIDAVSNYFFPLIIYIDDLQWANLLTIDILTMLVSKKNALNILLILSFRDTEVDDHLATLVALLKNQSSYMALKPLTSPFIESYIDLVFDHNIVNKDHAVRMVNGLSQGNPFYMAESVKILLQEKIISYSPQHQAWQVKAGMIRDFLISNDMESLLLSKMREEQHTDRGLLNLIACLGGNADYDILKTVARTDVGLLNENIDRLMKSALIVTSLSGSKKTLLFLHDIIFKLVQNNLSRNEKEALHYDIAVTVQADQSIDIDNKDSFIVSHLIRASKEMVKKDAQKWIGLLYKTGLQELQMASVEAALCIFRLCVDILPYCVSVDRAVFVNVHLALAECLCLTQKDDEYLKIVDMLEEDTKDTRLAVLIMRKQLFFSHYRREHNKVLKLSKQILKKLHFSLRRIWLPFDLIACRLIYTDYKINGLMQGASASNESIAAIMETLTMMTASAALIDDDISACIVLKAARLSARYGELPNAFTGYVAYAYVLFMIWGDREKAAALQDVILRMLGDTAGSVNKAFSYFIIGAYLAYWSKPAPQADAYLQESIRHGERAGDLMFLGYSITTSIDTKSFTGISLDHLLRYIEECQQRYPEIEQYNTTYNCEVHTQHILALKYGTDDFDCSRISRNYPRLTAFERLTEQILMLERYYLFGRLDLGYDLLKITTPVINSAKGLICQISLIFNSALIRIAVHGQLSKNQRRDNTRHIKRHLSELCRWARIHHDNFYSYYILANAEYEVTINGNQNARELYNSAIVEAGKQGNLRVEALANLRAAKYHQGNTGLEGFYAAQAATCYQQWGADYISQMVRLECGLTAEDEPATPDEPASLQSAKNPDITQFMLATAHLDEDAASEWLLKFFIENHFADYCCIIYENADELFLRYEIGKGRQLKRFGEMADINHVPHIAHRVIRYVGRTGQEVYLSPEQPDDIFAGDPHLQASPGAFIACIPMMYHNIFIGLFYFEKNGIPISEEHTLYVKSLIPVFISKLDQIKGVQIQKVFEPAASCAVLTDREVDLLKLVAEGLSNSEISEALNIALGTTKKHLGNIMTKLETNNRVKAILKARDLHII